MQEISWSNLRLKTLKDIKEGPCLKVTGDGDMAFYVVVEPQGLMRHRVEGTCSQIDTSKGR